MSTAHFRTALVTTLALLGVAAGAAAQDKVNLLASIEVKRLVANAQPADHARLRDHFVALADEYARKAERDLNMGRTLAGNPTRRFSTGPGAKYRSRANSETESAAILRELAEHHGRLAAGLHSEPPQNSARFDRGEGAPAPSEKQLKELAASARTAADHRVLADYYTEVAAANAKAADTHALRAAMHRVGGSRSVVPALDCDRLATVYREAAADARAAAAEHVRHAAEIG